MIGSGGLRRKRASGIGACVSFCAIGGDPFCSAYTSLARALTMILKRYKLVEVEENRGDSDTDWDRLASGGRDSSAKVEVGRRTILRFVIRQLRRFRCVGLAPPQIGNHVDDRLSECEFPTSTCFILLVLS